MANRRPLKPKTYLPITISQRQMLKEAKRQKALGVPEVGPYWRPTFRSECKDLPRPCPFLMCRHHLASDISPTGSLRLIFGEDMEVLKKLEQTCALDVAEEDGATLDRVAQMSNLTRERVRQIEVAALAKLKPYTRASEED